MIDIAITAQVMLFLVVLGLFAASGQASIFHPVTVYLVFHGIVFVLRPILVQYFGCNHEFEYMMLYPSEQVFVRTLLVSSVGFCVFVAACLGMSPRRTSFPPGPPVEFTPLQKRALLITTLVLLPAVAYSIYATRNGIQGENVGAVYIMTNSVGYINDVQNVLTPLLCAWIVVTRFHWLNLIPVALYLAYRGWFGWARWTIILFFLMAVTTYCWYRNRRWPPLRSIPAAVPFLVLFILLGQHREVLKAFFEGTEIPKVEIVPGMSAADQLRKKYDGPDFANFDFLTYIVAIVPDRTGTYSYGSQYLQLITEPIPRRLWKGKPVGAPVALFSLMDYGNFNGRTPSLCGDGWMSGGWIGLITTMALVGGLLGWAHRLFWKHVRNNMLVIFYLAGLAMVPVWYRDGGISITKFLLWTWLPLGMWLGLAWLMGRRFIPTYTKLLPAYGRTRLVSPPSGHKPA
jgi:hypothetical protein